MTFQVVIAVMVVALFIVAWTAYELLRKAVDKQRSSLQQQASTSLQDMFIFVDPGKLLMINLALFLTVPPVIYVLTLNPIFAIFAGIVIIVGPKLIIKWMKKRRDRTFELQLPDALLMIAGSLRAGASLNVALESMVSESRPPVSQEFDLLLREQRVGVDLDTALQNMEKRMPLQDFIMVVSGMRISREVGGNLADTLEGIADTLRRKHTMEGKINALTSQGRMQGIVMTCLPIFLMLVLKQMEPEAMAPLFNTWYGYITLGIIIVMEFVGYYFIRKIVNIDV